MTADQIIQKVQDLITYDKISFVLGLDIIACISDLSKSNTKNYQDAIFYSNALIELGYLR